MFGFTFILYIILLLLLLLYFSFYLVVFLLLFSFAKTYYQFQISMILFGIIVKNYEVFHVKIYFFLKVKSLCACIHILNLWHLDAKDVGQRWCRVCCSIELRTQYFKESKEIEWNLTGLENFDIGFCVLFDCYRKIWDYPNNLQFRKILSLQSFSNLQGNMYTKFLY